MRVLYVSKAMVVAAYRDKLNALADHCDVHLLVPDRWGGAAFEEWDADAVPVHRARALLHGHNHLHVYRRPARMIRQLAPDLVHIDEEPYSAVTYQLAHACATAHVPCVFFTWQNLNKRVPQPFRAMRNYVFRHAHGAIAGTSSAASVLNAAGCSLPSTIIPQMGVDAARFAPDPSAREAVRARLGVADDVFIAGFAGRLVPEKGVHVLIEALAGVADARLLVIGDGPERVRLESLAHRMMPARAVFAGHIASTAMPEWLCALDALVLPSLRTPRWEEQFGRVLVEAMACGIAVVGAATGEIPRVIGDGGVVVPESDREALREALRTLAASRVHRQMLGERGRLRVLAKYTHGRIAADTMEFYRTVLEAA